MLKLNKKYKIKTPSGWSTFDGIQKKKSEILELHFTDNTVIKCTLNHRLLTKNGFIEAQCLQIGNNISDKIIVDIKFTKEICYVYDPINVNNGNIYFSNDVISHNCEFLGSSHTLISGAKLKLLTWEDPSFVDFKDESGQLDIYDQPIPGHTYVISCDVSRGQGLDYQAFSVIDVTKIPYIQVAKYRNNKLPALVYPNIIERTGKLYNDAFVLVEINDIGQQIVDILHYELSYENLLKLAVKGKQGQNISAGYKKQIQFGVRTTTPVKRIGCSNLKTLVESNKLIIKDFDTISELTTFVATKESFAAEEGKNDDIVMSLVIFGWLVNQKVFKESIETDVRRVLEMEQIELMDDDYLPAPLISTGLDAITTIDQNGDVWYTVSKDEMVDKMRLGMF